MIPPSFQMYLYNLVCPPWLPGVLKQLLLTGILPFDSKIDDPFCFDVSMCLASKGLGTTEVTLLLALLYLYLVSFFMFSYFL